MRWGPAVFRGVLVALLFVGLAVEAGAGDAELAKFLLKHGRIAVTKGKYEDALTKLQKARTEDPTLIEATYWIAVAHEKSDDVRKAVREYRAFRRLAVSHERDGTLNKDSAKLLKKTMSRLKSLDAANMDIDKAQAAFADGLYDLVKTLPEEDIALAIRALTVIQRAAPQHREAVDLLAELKRGAVRLPATFDRVREWQDLIKNGLFGRNDGWTYAKRHIAVEAARGGVCRPPSGFDSGPAYAYTVDMTLKAIPDEDRTMTAGLIFGLLDGKGYGVILLHNKGKKDRIALAAMSLDPPKDRPLKVLDMDPWGPEQTRRLSVLVEGKTIQVYLDNVLVIEHEASGRKSLGGDIAVTHQNARLDMSRLRIGAITGDDK